MRNTLETISQSWGKIYMFDIFRHLMEILVGKLLDSLVFNKLLFNKSINPKM